MIKFEDLKEFRDYVKMFSEEISEDDPTEIRPYQSIQNLQSGEKLGDGANFAFIYGDEKLPNLYTYIDTKIETLEIDDKDEIDNQNPPGNFWKYKEQGIELGNRATDNRVFSFTTNHELKNNIINNSDNTLSPKTYPYIMERFGIYAINNPIISELIQNTQTGQGIRNIMINHFLPEDYRPIVEGESYDAHMDFSNAFKNMEKYRIYYRDHVSGSFSDGSSFFDEYSVAGEGTTIEHFDLLRPYNDNIQGVCISANGSGGPGVDSGYFASGDYSEHDILINNGLYGLINDYPFKTEYKLIVDEPEGGDEAAWQNMITTAWNQNISGQSQDANVSHDNEISISDWNENVKSGDNKLMLLFVIMPEWLIGNHHWEGARPDEDWWHYLYSGPIGVVPENDYPCDDTWDPGTGNYIGPWPLKTDGQTPIGSSGGDDCYILGAYEETLTFCGRGPSWPVFYKIGIDQRFFQLLYTNDRDVDHIRFDLDITNSAADIVFYDIAGTELESYNNISNNEGHITVEEIVDTQTIHYDNNTDFISLYYNWYFKLTDFNFILNGTNKDDYTFPDGDSYEIETNWPNWIENLGSLTETYDWIDSNGYVEVDGYGDEDYGGLFYRHFSYDNPIDYISFPNKLVLPGEFPSSLDEFNDADIMFYFEDFEDFVPIANIYSALDTDEDLSDEYYPLQIYIDSTDIYPATAPLIADLSFDIAKGYALGTCAGDIEANGTYDSCEVINYADISSDIALAEECRSYQYCEWKEGGNITYLDEEMWSNRLVLSGGIDTSHFPYDTTVDTTNWETFNRHNTVSEWNYDNNLKIPIGYKFAVLQWGDEPSVSIKSDFILLHLLDAIRRGIAPHEDLMLENKYVWQEVTLESYGPGPALDSGTIQHKYKSPGFYEIKALVFSYIPHPNSTDYLITPLRWKLVSITTNISYNYQTVEDFTSIGGGDFTTVPWPYPGETGIISGIDMNKDNKYKNSLESIINENKFNAGEFYERSKAYKAYENDEMGDYLGKSDIAQIRIFLGQEERDDGEPPYDMHNLLMIDPGPHNNGPLWDMRVNYCNELGGENCGTPPCIGPWNGAVCENIDPVWHPYYDFSSSSHIPGWLGHLCIWTDDCEDGQGYGVDTFSDSCVGIPYILENNREDLIENCIFEFNFGDIDGDIIYDNSVEDSITFDTTGKGNKGIFIGDYSLKKNEESPITKGTAIKFPEIGDKDNAF